MKKERIPTNQIDIDFESTEKAHNEEILERQKISDKYKVPNTDDLVKKNGLYYYKGELVQKLAEEMDELYRGNDNSDLYKH